MRHKAAIAAFAVFLMVDLTLLVVLYEHVHGERAAVGDEPIPSSVTGPPSPAVADTKAPDGRVGLVLSDSGILARVWQGRCVRGSRPRIEISRDAGKVFEEIALPLLSEGEGAGSDKKDETVRTVLQIRADSPDEITVVASDDQCVARRFDTKDGGQSWTPSNTIKTWYIDAAGTGVVSPDGPSDPGCSVAALSLLSDRNVKVACDDGTIRGTDNNGDEWVTLGSLNGVAGLTIPTLRDGFAVAPEAGCKSRAFVTADAGGQWDAAGCIARKHAATSMVGTAGALFALVGNDVHFSDDAGKTWKNRTSD